MQDNFYELPLILTANDVMNVLRISRSTAYEIMQYSDFPSFRIGKLVRVTKDDFLSWIGRQNKYIN